MTTFIDGPAQGNALTLTRAPIYLRVTHDIKENTWDALNQPEDEARPTEKLYAYILAEEPRMCHVQIRGKGKRTGGMMVAASYQFLKDQPSDEAMRDNRLWREWVDKNGQQPGWSK